MPSSMRFLSYARYQPLNDIQIRAISGKLLNGFFLDEPIPRSMLADVVQATDIRVGTVPNLPIMKMAKRDHVDSFFESGSLRLGTFNDFNSYEHAEIGDATEGRFLLIGRNNYATAFAELGGGFDQFAFCCYAGDPDPGCIRRFGYDDAYRINEPTGFARAVMGAIGAVSVSCASCLYSRDKAIASVIPDDFDFSVISHRMLELAGMAKFFVKPETYSHQCEFRFLWQMPSDVDIPAVIHCPEAVQFCERLASVGGA